MSALTITLTLTLNDTEITLLTLTLTQTLTLNLQRRKLYMALVFETFNYFLQVCWLGPKVGSCLVALFCIHHVNWVNSRNDSES